MRPVVINGVELSPEAVRTIDEFVFLGKTNEAAKTIREATGLGAWKSGSLANDWEITSKNMPCCPTCGSRNIRKLSAGGKVAAAAAFGLFSLGHLSKNHKCKNCGHKW